MRRNVLDFLDWVRGTCVNAGAKFVALGRPWLSDRSLGEYSNGVLTVCVENTDWPGVLAHEVSHVLQEMEKAAVWANPNADDVLFWRWIKTGNGLGPVRKRKVIRAIQRCELDAERRAVVLMKKFDLATPKALERYIRGAAVYLATYEFSRRYGVWVSKEQTEHIEPILLAAAPNRLPKESELGYISPKLEALLMQQARNP